MKDFLLLVLVLAVSVLILNAWAANADSACKEKYGNNAKVHGTKLMNECMLPDGTIKGL